MATHALLKFAATFGLSLLAATASADRRGIRVDGFGDSWSTYTMGTSSCPGTTIGSALLQRFSFTFSGRNNGAHLVDVYCQVANPGTLTTANFNYPDEPGLDFFFGANPENAIKGIRYSFLDRDRFDFDTPPSGFQWAIYSFPDGLQVVGLYGLEATTLDATSYITGSFNVWQGNLVGYGGEYFCFKNNKFIGYWNGTLNNPSSFCLDRLRQGIFNGTFEFL